MKHFKTLGNTSEPLEDVRLTLQILWVYATQSENKERKGLGQASEEIAKYHPNHNHYKMITIAHMRITELIPK